MYQFILFDLDGTLTDPKIGICTSVQYALRDAGIIEENLDVLEPFIGPPLKDSFVEYYQMSEEQAGQAVKKYRERFEVTGLYENVIYPGISDLLRALKMEGIKVGIASSKPTVFVEKVLVHFHIREFFDVVVGSELDGTRGRKEEVVSEALKLLVPNKNDGYDKCVMIGDRRFDVEGAKAHNLESIGVSYGYGGREELRTAGATYIVDTVSELWDLLLPAEKNGIKMEKFSFRRSFLKAWKILFPIVLYWLISNLVIIFGVVAIQSYLRLKGIAIGSLMAEWSGKISVYLNTLATLIAIPFLFQIFKKGIGKKERRLVFGKESSIHALLTAILGFSAALACNIALSYIDFSNLSDTYTKVSQTQYSISVPMGILVYGIITPIAEELLFRGIVFKRIEDYYTKTIGIIVSALIFGMYHGNLVQGIYGFLLGVFIAYCYVQFKHIFYPILFHGTANISVFIITQNMALQTMVNRPLNCLLLSTISIITLIQISRMKKD